MSEGTVFNIQRFSVHDGPGIRTTVFLSGCPMRCRWCHNPESLVAGSLRAGAGPSGTMSVGGVIDELRRDELFYEQSGGGVTVSGGEPLAQPEFLRAILAECRRLEFHAAVDTCGYAPEQVLLSVADDVDLFLFDLKVMDEREHMEATGVSNGPVLRNLEALDRRGCAVQLRFPLVPGLTDSDANVEAMIAFLVSNVRYRSISILPYHRWAAGKYERLGMPYDLADTAEPDADAVAGVRERFERSGFSVSIGG